MRTALLLLMSFTMGFAIMSSELLGGRILAPNFGSSIFVWGSIITVYMLALSLGYLIGGQWSMRAPSFRKFGLLFLVAGLSLLHIVAFDQWAMDWVFVRVEDPRGGALLASMLLFFVPSIIMGVAAPYGVRLLVESRESSGKAAGFLYFVSTLGSAAGTIMTSFYLVVWFEIDQIIYCCTGLLLMLGVLALLIKGGSDAGATEVAS
ncbi:fused MFS/spermidine synthase [Porticoccus sp. W117]|uniref:fused MFS/spermidine synthase n=1 Tax=Porticoccus sp. W117 TaxID=3054777 RepID=UPI002591CA22|nr:fused MFS/spermidine synthase [Porticoccus sp. W117]MDM3872406.1 fused MFS/spermidine synthase [Porticoccus sp. W117]